MGLLHTSYNKAAYTGLAQLAFLVLVVLLKRFNIELTVEESTVIQGVLAVAITYFVPNKVVEAADAVTADPPKEKP